MESIKSENETELMKLKKELNILKKKSTMLDSQVRINDKSKNIFFLIKGEFSLNHPGRDTH